MDVLRVLPIRVRLLLANLLLVSMVAGGAYLLVPANDLPLFYVLMFAALIGATITALTVARSITNPLSTLKSKLRESQETDSAVFRDRSSDEVGNLYRAVNEYVLYRDTEGGARRVQAPDEKRELQSQARELDNLGLLLEFGKLLSLNYDFGDAAHQVLERVNEHVQVEWSSVMVWSPEAGEMRLAASVGLDPKLSLDVRGGTRPPVQFKPGEGVSGEVFASGQPLVINKGYKDKRFKQFPKFNFSTRRINTLACVPLVHEGTTLGVANFVNIRSATGIFGDEHVVFLARISEVLAYLLAKSASFDTAFREVVSGLHSPAYFHHMLVLEGERIRRKPVPLSLVKLAIVFSDPSADQTFRNQIHARVGELIRKTFRRVDRATREGEAFLICLPGTDPLGALFTAGRLKEQIDSFAFDARDRQLFATAGGVVGYPEQVAEFHQLVSAVDAALAEAQRIGDNRVVCFKPEMAGVLKVPSRAPSMQPPASGL